MYNENLVRPMREELTKLGVKELKTTQEVDQVLTQPGTTLVVVNSVCGCAAGACRPAVALALKHKKLPTRLTTVFAGQDKDATARARDYFSDYPPSSPSIALLKDGEVVLMIERHQIEGKSSEQIAIEITSGFDRFC